MKFKEHCLDSIKVFGKPFEEVHKWLDAFAVKIDENGKFVRFDSHHRRYRHHLAGCEEVRVMWGDDAYKAAIRHVKVDLMSGEGLKENEELPANESDYLKKGFY